MRAVVVASAAVLCAGCSFNGVNNYALPFTPGSGSGATTITVVMANAANLVPNSEVKFNDVTVGSVRSIKLVNWQAILTVGIERSAKVPADVTAKIAQKSLLGAEYLELDVPGTASDTSGALASGQVIGLNRTSRYPETEEVLGAAAALLNGGGLPQLQTIIRETNLALGGRSADIHALTSTMTDFVTQLDGQRTSILALLENLNGIASKLNAQQDAVNKGLTQIPQGLTVINQQRQQLIDALSAVGRLDTVTHSIVAQSGGSIVSSVNSLVPVLKQLATHGADLAHAINDITYPFPTLAIDKAFQGDYINLAMTVSANVPQLEKFFLGATPLDGLYTAIVQGLPSGAAVQHSNPLLPLSLPTSPAGGASGIAGSSPSGTPTQPAPASGSLGGLLSGLLGGLGGK